MKVALHGSATKWPYYHCCVFSGFLRHTCVGKAKIILVFAFCTLCLYLYTGLESFDGKFTPEQATKVKVLRAKPRLLCYILLSPSKYHVSKIIKRTWGSNCDKLLFFGQFTSPLDRVNFVHLESREGYPYLWNKTKAAFLHLFKEYSQDYEWFLKADDDTFVIIENLKHFLSRHDYNLPLWSGFKLRSSQLKVGYYMSGGAGYVFSKEALIRTGNLISSRNMTQCKIDSEIGYEDLEIGKCLNEAGVHEINSLDSKGRHKFLPLPFRLLLTTGLSNFHWLNSQAWYKVKSGKQCCSPDLISMHKISPDEMQALHYLLYSIRITRSSETAYDDIS